MTKRDFELLAAVFRRAFENNCDIPGLSRSAARAGIGHTLTLLVDELEVTYPRFDRRKFLFAATGSNAMDDELSLIS